MGVPGFYRWAVRKVPKVRQTTRNPPYEFDCLYLDFNGVVHGCTNDWSGSDEEVLFRLIEDHLAFLVTIVRPTVMLFIALDGVAPRAKMNQQRSRRFRSAKNTEASADTIDGVAADGFDRNAITPGTYFMTQLSDRLRKWAEESASSLLPGVVIVISSDLDPGEGEHKIMNVIRHHPENSHCLYSNDADLVFLGLVSNAENVYLLRERQPNRQPINTYTSHTAVNGLPSHVSTEGHGEADHGQTRSERKDSESTVDADAKHGVVVNDESTCDQSGDGSNMKLAEAISSDDGETEPAPEVAATEAHTGGGADVTHHGTQENPSAAGALDYELLSIVAIRHWIASAFPECEASRVIADFVAMCCLAGNDFLPHIEAVDIYSGGLDLLLRAYCKIAPGEKGYLVDQDLNLVLPRWKPLLSELMKREAEQLLDSAGLGLGPKPPYVRGPGPPSDAWDGRSVLVMNVPAKAQADAVKGGMAKQGSTVSTALRVKKRTSRSPACWLVRFEEPRSAVQALVSIRRVWGQKVSIKWIDPSSVELADDVLEQVEPVDWRPAMDAAIRESFEFWLGPNLEQDTFLRRHVRAHVDRFVPLHVFTRFNRLRKWCCDIDELVRILQKAEALEILQESGESPMVRAVKDYSMRPEEDANMISSQHEAVVCFNNSNYLGAVKALQSTFYLRHLGPVPEGTPSHENLEALERHRSQGFLIGIEWVIKYYVQGCASWSWFYPGHYPPLCASLMACTDEVLDFPPLHAPFPPMLQLLAVLPPQSAQLLPSPLRCLLDDRSSPIAEFYPCDFSIDLKEGDREWQGIVLLPFVDEGRLRTALKEIASGTDWEHAGCQPAQGFIATLEGSVVTNVTSFDFSADYELPSSQVTTEIAV